MVAKKKSIKKKSVKKKSTKKKSVIKSDRSNNITKKQGKKRITSSYKDVGLPKRDLSKAVKQDIKSGGSIQIPVDKKKSKGKGFSSNISSKQSFEIPNISGHLANIGFSTEEDDFDTLDFYAQFLIGLLNEGFYTIVMLTKHEQFILFRYFYKTNPVLGRILDLHTDLPLSKLKLQAPNNVPEIVKDYVVQFFSKIFNDLHFAKSLKELVLHFWIYGEGYGLVEDYYRNFERKLQPIKDMESKQFMLEEEQAKKVEEIEDQYRKDPDSVKLEKRFEYLNLKFMNFFEKKYTGPERIRVIKFYDIAEYFENEDIGFEAIKYVVSDGLRTILRDTEDIGELQDLGYSRGFLELVKESEDKSLLTIDNDPYSGYPFIFSFKRYESISIVMRCFESCLQYENSRQAFKAKIKTLGKVGRIVTAEDLAEDKIDGLRSEVEFMMQDPSYVIVTNFSVEWNEVNQFFKDELNELTDSNDRIFDEIALGAGMPDSLIRGDSQYSGDTIKLEIVNNQYFNLKQEVTLNIENKILKPIALRKGLVAIDSWGTPTLIYPRLTFSRIALRSEEYFDILFSLYQKGSLPVSIIFDLLNLEAEDVRRAVEEDLWTINDSQMNELIRDLLSNSADEVFEQTDVVDRIIDNLNLKRKEEDKENEEDF